MMAGQVLHDAAQELARLGYRVFPVGRRDKKPPLTAHGYHDATTEPERITKWWTEHPDANIGMACSASGVVAIDIDPRNGGEQTFASLVEKLGELPATVEASTGGGGRHLVFAAPAGAQFKGSLGPGIDVKFEGYVVVPPSIHPSGNPYLWNRSVQDQKPEDLPADWRAAVLKAKTSAAGSPCTASANIRECCTPYGRAALDAELEAVRTSLEGTRNSTTNTAALKLARLHAGGNLPDCRDDLVRAATLAGLPEREARRAVENGWRAGLMTPRTMPPRELAPAARESMGAQGFQAGLLSENTEAVTDGDDFSGERESGSLVPCLGRKGRP